uniref:SSD domain-containing protein n=1 Tax=Panagrolaimus sp. ES5 TaxID=591445 RepID=A0AC34GVF6_9BILA
MTSTVEVSDPQPDESVSNDNNNNQSSPEGTTSVKYKSIDKLNGDEKKQDKNEPDDPAENSDGYTLDEKNKVAAGGTIDRNKNLKICHYVSGNENKVAPVIYTTDSFLRRNKAMKKNQFYKVGTFRFLEIGIKRVLFHIGKTAEDNGMLYMAVPFIMVAISLAGCFLFRDKFEITSPFTSFTTPLNPPTTSKSPIGLRSLMNSAIFNSSNPVYDTLERSSQTEFAFIISPRSNYDSVLENEIISIYYAIFEEAKKGLSSTPIKWKQACREVCEEPKMAVELLQSDDLILKYPEAVVKNDAIEKYNISRFYLGNLLGDCVLDADSVVHKAGSIIGKIKLKKNLGKKIYEDYERQLRNMINNITASPAGSEITIQFWSLQQFEDDTVAALTEAHFGLAFAALILVFFCLFICFKWDSYQSRPFIGIEISFICGLAILSGYSILFIGYTDFNSAAFPVVFVISAIGILFFYGYQMSWSRYSMTALHPIEKVAFIASWDGPCIILCFVSLIVATLAFTTLLIFGALYFTVAIYRSGKKEAEGLKWYHCCRDGDKTFTNKTVPDFEETAAEILHEKLTDLKPQFVRKLGTFLSRSGISSFSSAIFIFCVILTALAYPQANVTIAENDFVASNSPSDAYMNTFHKAYPNSEKYLEIRFEEPLDYYDEHRRSDILKFMEWAKNEKYAVRSISWLADYDRFQKDTIYDVTPQTSIPIIKYIFLASDEFKKYSSDINFDKYHSQIIRSRMYLELNDKGMIERNKLIKGLLEIAQDMNLRITVRAPFLFSAQHDMEAFFKVFSAYFVFEITATLIIVIFSSNPAIACTQLFASIVANLMVFDACVYLGIKLNILTLTAALIGNYFTVAAAIHFSYSYCSAGAKQNTHSLRVQYAFQCSFMPTVWACIALIALFVPLLTLQVPVLKETFKIFCLVSAATIINLLIFLPGMVHLLTSIFAFFNTVCKKYFGETSCAITEQSAESIFFIPSGINTTPKAIGYTHSMNSQRMIMAPHHEIPTTLSRSQHRIDRYAINESIDNNCDIKSLDSRREGNRSTAMSSRHQTPRNDRRTLNRRRGSDVTEQEQIYEEPESPTPLPRPPMPLPIRDYAHHNSHHHLSNPSYPSYHRGLARDEYFRYDRGEMEIPPWRQYFVNNTPQQRYHAPPPPSMIPYPISPSMRTRRFM